MKTALSTQYVTSRDPGEGSGAPLLFSEQTEARRGDIKIFGDRAPLANVRHWMTPPSPPLSQGLDPALVTEYITRFRTVRCYFET